MRVNRGPVPEGLVIVSGAEGLRHVIILGTFVVVFACSLLFPDPLGREELIDVDGLAIERCDDDAEEARGGNGLDLGLEANVPLDPVEGVAGKGGVEEVETLPRVKPVRLLQGGCEVVAVPVCVELFRNLPVPRW